MTPKQITDWPAGPHGAGTKALEATARSFDAVANRIAALPPAERPDHADISGAAE